MLPMANQTPYRSLVKGETELNVNRNNQSSKFLSLRITVKTPTPARAECGSCSERILHELHETIFSSLNFAKIQKGDVVALPTLIDR